jgi:predicted metal-binding membrane protein
LPFRDRVLVLAEIGALTLLGWIYLVRMPMTPADLGACAARLIAPLPSRWVGLWLVFMMWAVMMVAMMMPSASPMILMYARIARGRSTAWLWQASMFAAGYVFVWTAFSLFATAGQALLVRAAMISNGLSATPIAGGAILIVAGIYQLTPLKDACLGHCRSPYSFFMTRWRDGALAAFRMGVEHGVFCVGCCWLLMALLFVVGVMNLAWVAAISILVLLEKATPYGRAIANTAGAALIASGAIVAFLL